MNRIITFCGYDFLNDYVWFNNVILPQIESEEETDLRDISSLNPYQSALYGNLYYYPQLDELLEALESGKDVSSRISYVNILELFRNSMTYIHNDEEDNESLPAQLSSSVAKASNGPLKEGFIPMSEVKCHKMYYRNGLVFSVFDHVCALDLDYYTGNWDEEIQYNLYGDYLHPDYLTYADSEEIKAEMEEIDASDMAEYMHQLFDILNSHKHKIVAVSLDLSSGSKSAQSSPVLLLTNEPIENFCVAKRNEDGSNFTHT